MNTPLTPSKPQTEIEKVRDEISSLNKFLCRPYSGSRNHWRDNREAREDLERARNRLRKLEAAESAAFAATAGGAA